jgi:hypothetical protein
MSFLIIYFFITKYNFFYITFQLKVMDLKDSRVKMMNEILNGIKVSIRGIQGQGYTIPILLKLYLLSFSPFFLYHTDKCSLFYLQLKIVAINAMFSNNAYIYFIQLCGMRNYLIAIFTVIGNPKQLYIRYFENFSYNLIYIEGWF